MNFCTLLVLPFTAEEDKLYPSIQGINNNNIKDLSKCWASLVCEPKDSETRNDYQYSIFSVLSIAHAWASVILAGKRGSRRHSATCFSENVVVAETGYQVLSFCYRERAQTSFSINNRTNIFCEKKKEKKKRSFPGCLFFRALKKR